MNAALDGYDSLLTLDSPAAWAAFLLWSVPLPVTIGAVLRLASAKAVGEARAPLETIENSKDKPRWKACSKCSQHWKRKRQRWPLLATRKN